MVSVLSRYVISDLPIIPRAGDNQDTLVPETVGIQTVSGFIILHDGADSRCRGINHTPIGIFDPGRASLSIMARARLHRLIYSPSHAGRAA